MKKALAAITLAVSALAAAPPGVAQDYYRAVASGQAEAPPNGSPGSSVAAFEIDGLTMYAEVPFRDLLSGTVAAHIHCCTTEAFTGVSAVAVPFVDFPLQVTAGEYSASFDLADAAVYDPAFLAAFGGTAATAGAALLDALAANQAYLNIHTGQYPGGEIRGFLVAAPIPEPATWGMLGVGLAGLALVARRRPRMPG